MNNEWVSFHDLPGPGGNWSEMGNQRDGPRDSSSISNTMIHSANINPRVQMDGNGSRGARKREIETELVVIANVEPRYFISNRKCQTQFSAPFDLREVAVICTP